MLFDRRAWTGIADGSITCTFRRWKTRRAIAGHRYRTPAGMIEVDAVTLVAPDAITDDDALGADEVTAIERRLDRSDARSADGPWTRETLRLIEERPAVRAADLASLAGRETAVFKRRVRALKEMGLTRSLEIGYWLSPRGEAFMRMRATGR